MFDRYPQNQPQRLEIENNIQRSFLIFKYLSTLKDKLVDLKDSIFLIIHKFYKSFN